MITQYGALGAHMMGDIGAQESLGATGIVIGIGPKQHTPDAFANRPPNIPIPVAPRLSLAHR